MPESDSPPVAFIQVDLDGLWAVRRCYGLAGSPEQDDPVYSLALPALLELFDQLQIKATFFVVGADAPVAWKCRHLRTALERGHELANHSMTHDLAFARLPAAQRESEVAQCQRTLRETLGVEARGFRAPGYGFSPALVQTLIRMGFSYDASLLPTPWGWLMRWIGRRISLASDNEKIQYGSFRDWRAPLHPFPLDRKMEGQLAPAPKSTAGHGAKKSLAESQARSIESSIWEIPVSVSRRGRLPFHGGIGYLLGRRWVDRAIGVLARREGFLNYVIHGMDLVDGRKWEVVPTRKGRWFFQGGERERLEFFAQVCRRIAGEFETCRTDGWVEQARKTVKNH